MITTAYCGRHPRLRLIGARPRYITTSEPLMGVPAVTWVCCKTSRSVSPLGVRTSPVAVVGAGLTVGIPEDEVREDDV